MGWLGAGLSRLGPLPPVGTENGRPALPCRTPAVGPGCALRGYDFVVRLAVAITFCAFVQLAELLYALKVYAVLAVRSSSTVDELLVFDTAPQSDVVTPVVYVYHQLLVRLVRVRVT